MADTLRNAQPSGADWDSISGRDDPSQRFRIYKLCDCETCEGSGWIDNDPCPDCRREGRVRLLVATCADAETVGVALVTLGREGVFDECAIGILDTQGAVGEKWIVRPWLPSPRNTSDAGRVLQSARKRGPE